MSDNILTLADMRLATAEITLTPEGALMRGEPPLLEVPRDMDGVERVVYMKRLCRLSREYLIDYDLVRACARAGIEWELVKGAERDPVFVVLVQQMQEELTPEQVVTRTEVLVMLEREACTSAKARDRISAMKALAHIAGFTNGDDSGSRSDQGAPVINVTLTQISPDCPSLGQASAAV